ncbi:uroporphyrinogen decarboxylase [Aquicella lusitana]|uniref:Uroporphyrinogen decarboxylase n=1 Tax=Aquicella lusitana TaxID=254246 RepID=A0A370G2U3_9COXI|nr:uroporphyrinogen decarboxylase [Aquicella lusitana]RDI38055.1 uroporphyrinogen decarboxylase [Aquicella lusitana]VVC72645.1 Uroporphyrinogen decarboxylase [Aquicella lusitana]
MPELKNDRLLKALARQPVDMTPVWIMRQAGRYLPEYRATRERAGSFMKLCKTPELACEVTLQPIERFPLDAAIIFSDILTIPDAMGLGLNFIESKGPVFARPLQREAQIKGLEVPDPARLQYVYEAISLVKHELADRVPLIGFCGSPWTLAAYMIEGESSPGFPRIMQMMQENPALLHNLLDILAKSVTAHLEAQIQAGADVMMLFDTWGGLLDNEKYREFSLNYAHQIIARLRHNHYNKRKPPFILFTKGGSRFIDEMVESGCDALGLDWEISLAEARHRARSKVALQGNMHPACLLESPEVIRQEVAKVLASFGQGEGHVFNLGHGITPDVPPEHVAVLVEAVHELSQPYHQKG